MRRLNVLASLLACLAATLAFAHEEGDCAGFTWDVSLQLSGGDATVAGITATSVG